MIPGHLLLHFNCTSFACYILMDAQYMGRLTSISPSAYPKINTMEKSKVNILCHCESIKFNIDF